MQNPPYPSTTKAGGFKFELDCDRMFQSDTWALANARQRPLLLMLWVIAWRQTPCGSLPNDDTLITVRLGIDTTNFQQDKSILLRGWKEATDGRLYHPVLTELVLGMIDRKSRETQRKALYRQKQREAVEAALSRETHAGLPSYEHRTDEEEARESGGSDSTTTTTITTTIDKSTPAGIDPVKMHKTTRTLNVSDLVAEGVDKQHAANWLTVRKAKRAPLTRTAWDGVKIEAEKAGITPADAVRLAAGNSWQGFKASWLENTAKNVPPVPPSSRHTGFDSKDYGQGGRI